MPLRYVSPIAILFLTGMFIKVASSHQKALFNLDPEHSSFSGMLIHFFILHASTILHHKK